MPATRVPKDGAAIDTKYLAVAQVIHGKIVIIGDLKDSNDASRAELSQAARNTVSPGKATHLVEVTVVGRICQLEGEHISPPIIATSDKY